MYGKEWPTSLARNEQAARPSSKRRHSVLAAGRGRSSALCTLATLGLRTSSVRAAPACCCRSASSAFSMPSRRDGGRLEQEVRLPELQHASNRPSYEIRRRKCLKKLRTTSYSPLCQTLPGRNDTCLIGEKFQQVSESANDIKGER